MSLESAVPGPGSRLQRGDERVRVILCQYCGYDTDRKNNLKRHVHTMHEASPVELECCGQRFFSKADLRAHTRQMHRHGYMCPVCRHVFCRKALLRRHLSVHTGIKDFICSVCKYDTSHKSNLERHLRSHLKNPDLAAAAQKALADLEASRSSAASESASSHALLPVGASSNDLQDRSSNTVNHQKWTWPWALSPRHLHSPPPPPLLPCPPETTLQPVRQPCPRRGFTIEALLQTDESSGDSPSSGAPQGEVAGEPQTVQKCKYPASVSLAARAAAGVLRPTPRHAPAMDLSVPRHHPSHHPKSVNPFHGGLLTVVDVTSPMAASYVHPPLPNNNNTNNIIHNNSNNPFHGPPPQGPVYHSFYRSSIFFGLFPPPPPPPLPSPPPPPPPPSLPFPSPPSPSRPGSASPFATPTSHTLPSPPEGYPVNASSPHQAPSHEYEEPVSSPEAVGSSASSSSPGRVSGPEERTDGRGQEYVHKKLRFSRKLRQDEASLCEDHHETSRV